MQTSAVGSLNHRSGRHWRSIGFTLLELLVVVAIVAIASAGVGFAMRDGAQVQIERDADRLAALLESARARSRASGLPVRWHDTADGFEFTGLPSTGSADNDLPTRWLDPDTRVSQPTVLLLGPDPIIEPQVVVLISASLPGKSVRLASDGVRPFAVQPAVP